MSDLIILFKNKSIIQNFNDNPEQLPNIMVNERVVYWKKYFSSVKKDFENHFSSNLTKDEIDDLNRVLLLRNAIAHSHVSVGRDSLFYIPNGGSKNEQEIESSFGVNVPTNVSNPKIYKLNFKKDADYNNEFAVIQRIDSVCLKKISSVVGIQHSRVR